MGTVIVEQFNPVNGYWNKLYEIDQKYFNPDDPITVDKYGGSYRTRVVGEEVVIEKATVAEKELLVVKDTAEKPKFNKRFFKTFEDDDGEID